MRQHGSIASRVPFSRHVLRHRRCELLGIRWTARAIAKAEHGRGIVVYMATELADAHIERCKEEVEVLEEPIGVAGAKVG